MAYKSVRTWVLSGLNPRIIQCISKFKGLKQYDVGRVRFIGDTTFCTLGSVAMEKLRILDTDLFEKIGNGSFHYTVLKIEGHNIQNYYAGTYSVRAASTSSEIALMIFVVRRYYLSICAGRTFSAFFFKNKITKGLLDSERQTIEWLKQKGLGEWIDECRRDFRT